MARPVSNAERVFDAAYEQDETDFLQYEERQWIQEQSDRERLESVQLVRTLRSNVAFHRLCYELYKHIQPYQSNFMEATIDPYGRAQAFREGQRDVWLFLNHFLRKPPGSPPHVIEQGDEGHDSEDS